MSPDTLLRRGKIDSAQSVTICIGKMIAGVRSRLLSKASASDTKQLWQLLRSTRNWSRCSSNSAFQRSSLSLTANDLNAHFTDIATDPHYSRDMLDDNLRGFGDVDLSTFVPFSADLGRIRATSPGPEEIPYWLYKTCAVELGPVVAKLVNFSLTQRTVPLVWKTAHITQYPKLQL